MSLVKFPIFFIAIALANKHTVTFPEITSWKNQPVVEFEQNKKALLKKDQPLKNAFIIKTATSDEVEVVFSGGETLHVFANSKVAIPQISPDTGEISEIVLTEGRVRLKSGPTKEKNLRLKSVFFDMKMPANVDLFMTIDMNKPSVRFDIVRGELSAEFFDYEKNQALKEGESLTFKGEREGDSIKYDYLLDSRKAPHGVLQSVEKFDISAYSAGEAEQKKLKIRDLEKQKKLNQERLKKKIAYENSFLCRKPFAQLNQCHWKKKNDLCYRYRCNGSGQWGDETERPVTQACAGEKVVSCDY